VENNLQLWNELAESDRLAIALGFVGSLVMLADEIAVGDIYTTFGSTREKTNFSFSIAVDGNRETVYHTNFLSLMDEVVALIASYYEDTEENVTPF